MRKENGFTLLETVIALFIGSFMLIAIYTAINFAQSSSSKIEKRITAQQDARSALEIMAMEIQMASYNPTMNNNIWFGNPVNLGIQVATANSIMIEMDITDAAGAATNGNGVIDGENEMICYNYDTINQRITRATKSGIAANVTYDFLGSSDANVDTKTVLVTNASTAVSVFRYYDGSGTLIPNPSLGRIRDIRRVEITLVADTANSDPGGGRRRIIYSTSVIPRNHIPSF